MKLRRFATAPTMRCNLNCAHCYNGGSTPVDITREVIREALADIEAIDRFYIGATGELTEDLDGMEMILEELRAAKIPVRRFRYMSNLTRKSSRLVELIGEYQKYAEAKRSGKILSSSDVFHFGRFVPVEEYVKQRFPSLTGRGLQIAVENVAEKLASSAVFVQDPEAARKHEEVVEWYKEKTGLLIHDRPYSNERLLFQGNALANKKEIMEAFPTMQQLDYFPVAAAIPDPEGALSYLILYPTGEVSLTDSGILYSRSSHAMAGNVLDGGLKKVLDRYNDLPKIRTLGRINALSMMCQEHISNRTDNGYLLNCVGYFFGQIEPILPAAKEEAETEQEKNFVDVMENTCQKLREIVPMDGIQYPGWMPEENVSEKPFEDLS